MHFLAQFCFLSSKPLKYHAIKKKQMSTKRLKIPHTTRKTQTLQTKLVQSLIPHSRPPRHYPFPPLPPPFSQFPYLPLVPHGSLACLSPALIQRVARVVECIAIIVRDVGVDHFGFLSLGFLLEMQLVPQPARKAKKMSLLFAEC